MNWGGGQCQALLIERKVTARMKSDIYSWSCPFFFVKYFRCFSAHLISVCCWYLRKDGHFTKVTASTKKGTFSLVCVNVVAYLCLSLCFVLFHFVLNVGVTVFRLSCLIHSLREGRVTGCVIHVAWSRFKFNQPEQTRKSFLTSLCAHFKKSSCKSLWTFCELVANEF